MEGCFESGGRMTASHFECPSRLTLNDARTLFRTACPARTSDGRLTAVAKAGHRQHSKRFEPATRIYRVSQTWPKPIGALTIVWLAVCLILIKSARRYLSVRLAYRELPKGDPAVDWPSTAFASSAARLSPRQRASGFRCLIRFLNEFPSRRGMRHGFGANRDDFAVRRWESCEMINPCGLERPARGLLV